ncbi:MAG: hypothetical protein DRP35_08975 [Candidatus Zixiibacteriota bacterium]|nr:MAG: hypothetical protein DRP35_08975 [candidate division Zixibacteria bacterium]
MKKIIVPVDFSPNACNALQYAINFANKVGASIRIIFVKKDKNYENRFMVKEFANSGISKAEDLLKKIVDENQSKLKTEFEYSVRHGNIAEEITNEAKYNDAYMIIMGTHGASGFQEFWMGSNAFRVVSSAPCPVITVPDKYKIKKIDKIVLPIDMSVATREKVNFTAELAQTFNSKILIAGVSEGNYPRVVNKIKKYVEQVEKLLDSKKIENESFQLSGKNIADTIIDFSYENKARLISIMTEQVPNIANAIMGTYAQQTVNHSNIPVLSIRPKIN